MIDTCRSLRCGAETCGSLRDFPNQAAIVGERACSTAAQGALMQVFVVMVPLAILAACSPETDVTASTSRCVAANYSSYDEKNFNQCVAACIKCEHGVTTTCTTACKLRGAR
jgi:hypothetical protein